MLKPGLSHEITMKVSERDTASKYGSGLVEVFATPAMIALMEKTCLETVLPHLPAGFNTVGTAVNVSHCKATPVGMNVNCKAELSVVDGRQLVFSVKAFDEEGEIGSGTHTRFIINTEKFMAKFAR